MIVNLRVSAAAMGGHRRIHMFQRFFAFVFFAILFSVSGAAADDWKVVDLDGDATTLHGRAWVKLKLGDVISRGAVTRTLANGSLKLMRDRESIALSPGTEIEILDHVGERYTTVREHFGTVGVEANVENVRHFAVETSLMAAVVKGTVFSVHANANSSVVVVSRGVVSVSDFLHHTETDVHEGESAKVTKRDGVVVKRAPATDPDTAVATAAAAGARAGGGASADTAAVESAMNEANGRRTISARDAAVAAKVASSVAVLPEDDGIRESDDADFRWVEGRNGRAILTPIFEIMSKLKGFDAYASYISLTLLWCLIAGVLSAIVKEIGFGFILNLLITLAASILGVLMRDGIFYDAINIKYEPYLSIGLVLGSIVVVTFGTCAARVRMLA